MNCENIKEKLSLYIDNLLDPDEADEIKKHIESCDSCQVYYNKLLKLGEMVDGFEISDKEEYWESQKDKVLEQIEQAESDKIIKVQPFRKKNNFYKYMAVAASLALVAFVSIYESQEFRQTTGLFDDGQKEAISGQSLDKIDVEKDLTEPDQLEKITEPASAPKRLTKKLQAVSESEEKVDALEEPKGEPMKPEPVSQESSLELGEAIEVSFDAEPQAIIKPTSISSHSVDMEPLSFRASEAEIKSDKNVLHEVMQDRAVDNLGKSDLDLKESIMSQSAGENLRLPAEPVIDADSVMTEINIYKIRLDSLEKEYDGIYSPHYRESKAKGRIASASESRPVSLDPVIMELAETCFQVGILSTDEKEREEMISKLRRLSIHGNPESIEKIQRYIVLLLAAE